jgi:hypothetical protein
MSFQSFLRLSLYLKVAYTYVITTPTVLPSAATQTRARRNEETFMPTFILRSKDNYFPLTVRIVILPLLSS